MIREPSTRMPIPAIPLPQSLSRSHQFSENSEHSAAQLADWLDARPIALGGDWVEGLEDRKREEAEFHDDYRANHQNEQKTAPNQRFYDAASVVNEYVDEWIRKRPASGTGTFLDYACGDGTQTLSAARAGAKLAVGIDISETSIRNAIENAAAAGVSDRTRFLQRDCEDTGLPAGSFSSALCSGMLHHLDLSRAFPELARLMDKGGRILCVEALSHNPIIQLYRNRTPELRTEWEKSHILGMRELEYAKRWFMVENVRFFLMAAPLATLLPAGRMRGAFLRVGHAIDGVATRIPGLQRWSWQFAFELVKA
jgi:ubiquinone/menaquinone biosynthesis C-methylase UbiE